MEKYTKKDMKKALRRYSEDGDYTAFCRTLHLLGVEIKAKAIYDAVDGIYSDRFMMSRLGFSAYDVSYGKLTEWCIYKGRACTYAPLAEMKRNKAAGPYKKILFEGNRHIWWCSPLYGHRDYNKSIFGVNDERNRARMRIINAYLNGGELKPSPERCGDLQDRSRSKDMEGSSSDYVLLCGPSEKKMS